MAITTLKLGLYQQDAVSGARFSDYNFLCLVLRSDLVLASHSSSCCYRSGAPERQAQATGSTYIRSAESDFGDSHHLEAAPIGLYVELLGMADLVLLLR